MRSLVYTIAVLASAGIMYGIIVMPDSDQAPTTKSVEKASAENAAFETVAINVPEMMCQFSCFPHIKETLEDLDAISEVTLAEQPNPNALDNRQVIVTHRSGFDPKSVLGLLAAEGFGNSEVVQ